MNTVKNFYLRGLDIWKILRSASFGNFSLAQNIVVECGMQVFTNMGQCIPIINFLQYLSKREIHENQFSAKMKSFTVDEQYSSLGDSIKTKRWVCISSIKSVLNLA